LTSVPADTDTITYAPVGELVDGEFVAEYVMNSMTDLGMTVQNGMLCYTFDDGN